MKMRSNRCYNQERWQIIIDVITKRRMTKRSNRCYNQEKNDKEI